MPSGEYNDFKPSGYDRATGLDGLPGTLTPPGLVLFKNDVAAFTGLPYFFEELPDSPQIERGEQTTITHRFRCDDVTGKVYISGLQRGQLLTDSDGNLTKVLSSSLDRQKGDYWILTVVAEGVAGIDTGDGVSALDVPPDEFGVETLEFNPSIYRHPRYITVANYNLDASGDVIDSDIVTGPQIIGWINAAVNFPQLGSQTEAYGQINSDNIADEDVLALAFELLQKVRKGIDTFYMAGFKVTYSSYYYFPPDLNPGGYIEDPVASGNLPSYFWSNDGSGDSTTNIFTTLAKNVAPALYLDNTGNVNISWLRQADYLTYQRTWFKLTSTWIGAPYGTWDANLYNPKPPAPEP